MTAYQIHPTALGKSQENLYTDISLSNLFNIFANQINSTRQVLWQRYHAMLIANSLFFGLLGVKVDQTVIGATAGIMLCSIWIVMFALDWWNFYHHRLGLASRFEWTQLAPEANPFEEMAQEKVSQVIYLLALCVAVLFLSFNIIILYKNI